jgi:two-component system, NtrC family, sensor kinase
LLGELEGVLAPLLSAIPKEARAELDYLVPELVQNLRDIGTHGRRADAIIRSMLMHSRTDSGTATLEDIETLVRESLGLSYHAMKAAQKGFECRVEVSFDPRVPPLKMVRPNLGRVLINLFTNAFQAIQERQSGASEPDWRPQVTASSEWLGSAIRITVEDNGAGLKPDLLDKIFQPFFTTKPPGEGTGLGLSISYEIIQNEFGGTLEAQTVQEGRTQFLVTLPVSSGVQE